MGPTALVSLSRAVWVDDHEPPMLLPHAVEPFKRNESTESGCTVHVPLAHGAFWTPEIVTTRPAWKSLGPLVLTRMGVLLTTVRMLPLCVRCESLSVILLRGRVRTRSSPTGSHRVPAS